MAADSSKGGVLTGNPSQKEGVTAPSAWKANPGGLVEILRGKGKSSDFSYEKIQQRRDMAVRSVEVPAEINEGKVSITIPKEILERNTKMWENGLVGRFTGPRPDLDKIRRWVEQKWKGNNVEVAALPKGCVLFNFQKQEEMLGVLLKAPWYLEGKGLLLEKWHEDFNPRDEEAQLVPVWVQVPGLPLQSWDNDIIRSIANAIGKLVAIDGATSNKTRFTQARFCVLVRTDKPVPTSVELNMGGKLWIQELIYENLKARCKKCKTCYRLPQLCKGRAEDAQPKKRWVVKQDKEATRGESEKKDPNEVGYKEEERCIQEKEEAAYEQEGGEDKGGDNQERKEDTQAEEKEKEPQAEAETREDPATEEDSSEGFERVQTRSARRREGRMDVGAEEKKVGRPTDRERREKEAASQIDAGIQRTLDSVKGKAKIKK